MSMIRSKKKNNKNKTHKMWNNKNRTRRL
jgi:hypothetical protein